MSLKATDETIRIDFGGGDWIDIRKTMRRGDSAFAQDYMAAVRTQMPDTVGILMGSYNSALLSKMIVGWSLADEISIQAVNSLDDNVAARVLGVLDENNKVRTEEEAGPLGNSSSSPSESPVDDSASTSTRRGQKALVTSS